MIEIFINPLRYDFILRGLAGGLMAALACAMLSGFVVWRKMAFMGDAMAHSILPGIVVAYVLGISMFWGGLVAALFAAAGIAFFSRRDKLSEDAAIGVVFAGFFALGILLLGKVLTLRDLGHILFGNILGVSSSDLAVMGTLCSILILVVVFLYKEIIAVSFDPSHAKSIGLSPDIIRYIILTMMAFTTVIAVQTVGVVLVLALLVTPGAAASLVSRRMKNIILISVILAVLATFVGVYTSFYADLPSGPVIVLTLTVMFLFCAGFGHLRNKKTRPKPGSSF